MPNAACMKSKYYLKYIGLAVIILLLCWYYHFPSAVFLRNDFKGSKTWKQLRAKIYASRWIKLFPEIKNSLALLKSEGSVSEMTNAIYTRIFILNQKNIKVGGLLKATIVAYNGKGQRKTHGGDFFLVLLRRRNSEIDGVACEVNDNMNGKYSVQCILPWKGPSIIIATLVHPFETIFQLMKNTSSETPWGVYLKTKMLNSKNEVEFTYCAVGFQDRRPDELCDYSNPTHGEKRTCIKPSSGECPEIIEQEAIMEPPQQEAMESIYCRSAYNWNARIVGSGKSFYVERPKNPFFYAKKHIHSYSMNPMTPSGWFFNSNWVSIKKIKEYSPNFHSMTKCVKNKRIYFFGDSTARNMYNYIIDTLKIKDFGVFDNTHFRSRGRDANMETLNATFQYRSHGAPMINPGPDDARPYMSDSLDAIRVGGKGTIVMFTIGYHFEFYDPDVYLSRIEVIKQTVLSLLSRLPGTKIIIKGLHYKNLNQLWRSPWFTYRLEVLLRQVFRDVENVFFMENWDMSILLRNEEIHPPMPIFIQTIKLLLSYLC